MPSPASRTTAPSSASSAPWSRPRRVAATGGDEFALILPGASVAEASRVADRVRTAVSALTGSDPEPVTITIGVAGLPGDAADRAGLIEAADTALYYGKRAGQDRVVR